MYYILVNGKFIVKLICIKMTKNLFHVHIEPFDTERDPLISCMWLTPVSIQTADMTTDYYRKEREE
jgi:hypothetical protein